MTGSAREDFFGDVPSGPRNVAPARFMTAVGGACIVLGGLVAAATDPLNLSKGSWLAAYLVLVGGVAQWAMGVMQAPAGTRRVTATWEWVQAAAWNLGNVGVVVGSLSGTPGLVDAAAVPLLIALGVALRAAWLEPKPASRGRRPQRAAVAESFRWGYRIMLIILVVSVPIGMLLAHLRAP